MEKKPPKIYVDQRDLRSHVPDELEKLGIEIDIKTLEVADYILSDRCAVERKRADDFLKSLIEDRKLFEQLFDLMSSYRRPLLIIEGDIDAIFTMRRTHPHAIQSLLSTIAVSFKTPILYSLNAADSAFIMAQIAEKEQKEDKRPFNPHGKRSVWSIEKQREYIINAVTEVGPVLAHNLLRHFGSVEKCFSASVEELMEVPKIGEITALHIREIVGGQNGTEEHLRSGSESS